MILSIDKLVVIRWEYNKFVGSMSLSRVEVATYELKKKSHW